MPFESTLSTHITADGRILAVQDWMLEPGLAVRGVVLVVHGWGEHAGRYDALADQLNAWGFATRGYDQHGHGQSHGRRGSLPYPNCLLTDLVELIDETRLRMAGNVPLILLGHGMGAVIAAQCVARKLRPVEGLVMCSPAMEPRLSSLQKAALWLLARCLPDRPIRARQNPSYLTHDAGAIKAYLEDGLIHHYLSPRLAADVRRAASETLLASPDWQVPALLLYSGADRWVSAEASRQFVASAPPVLLANMRFDALYHELFNESDKAPVLAALQHWLGLRF